MGRGQRGDAIYYLAELNLLLIRGFTPQRFSCTSISSLVDMGWDGDKEGSYHLTI